MRSALLFIAFLSILSTSNINAACGWGGPVYVSFYDLFISDGNNPDQYYVSDMANINAWEKYFNGHYQNVSEIVYTYSIDQVSGLLKKEKKKNIVEALEYLLYAKEMQNVSDRFSTTSGSWDYYDIVEEHEYDEKLYKKGLEGYKKAKSREIQLRYAYQVVRYLHYSRMYEEAIEFYNKNVKETDSNYEIYYYCLDQVSGCQYATENYAQAAYGFLNVFMNSSDRKEPALNSFRIHYQWDFDKLVKLCKNDEEKAYAKSLVTGKYYNTLDAEWILNNAFNEEVLLSIYYGDNVHEEGKYYWMNQENYRWMNWSDQENIELDRNIAIISGILKNSKTKHHDFWNLALAYLQFMKGEFSEAYNYSSKIKSTSLVNNERFEFFRAFFEITKSGALNDEVENGFLALYEATEKTYTDYELNVRKDLFFTLLKFYYYDHNQVMKAGLVSMAKGDADQIYDLGQLNDLKKLYEDKTKNKLEKFLLEKSLGETLNITDYVNEKTGSYYLMTHNYEKALEFFNKLPEGFNPQIVGGWESEYSYNYTFDGYSDIPAKIFSANIAEGFNFDMDYILTDNTYALPQFSFIKETFSKKELTEYLIKLKELAKSGNSNAFYLLGNYYYNTSVLGYFRNILIYYPENNYCSTCQTNSLLDKYNVYSYDHYQKALNSSTNKEMKAKITYMMAKNVAYDWDRDKDKKVYFTLFHSLVSDYKGTKFYKEIIEECSQFKYYAFSLYPAKEGVREDWYGY